MDVKLKYKAKKIKIVFFDIDDTLRVKDTGFMPASIQRVFESLKEKGILIGIASGRGIFGVVPEIRELEPDFFVTLNGAYVEDKKGQVVSEQAIPQNIVEKYIAWTKEVGIEYGLVGSHGAALSARSPMINQAIDVVYQNLPVDPDFYQSEKIYQMWTFPTTALDPRYQYYWYYRPDDTIYLAVADAALVFPGGYIPPSDIPNHQGQQGRLGSMTIYPNEILRHRKTL